MSPATVTAASSSFGISFSSVRPVDAGCSALASSAAVKPSTERSAPSADRSRSSSCSMSRSQPAFSAMRLSASTSCRRCTSVSPSNADDRHLGEPKLARRRQAAVAGNDVAVVADQDRIGEPERPDAACDLGDLRVAVRARIARRRHQPIERPELKPQAPAILGRDLRPLGSCHLPPPATPPTLNFAANFRGLVVHRTNARMASKKDFAEFCGDFCSAAHRSRIEAPRLLTAPRGPHGRRK